jgi:hypothetical protein
VRVLQEEARQKGHQFRPGKRGKTGGKLEGRANAPQFSPADLVPCGTLAEAPTDSDVLRRNTTIDGVVGAGRSGPVPQASNQPPEGPDREISEITSSLLQWSETLDLPSTRHRTDPEAGNPCPAPKDEFDPLGERGISDNRRSIPAAGAVARVPLRALAGTVSRMG